MGKSAEKKETFDICNPNDFKSVQLMISLYNHTSHTEIRAPNSGSHYREEEILSFVEDEIKLIEFLDHGIVLNVPNHTCATKHKLSLYIKTVNSKNDVELSIMAKVEKVEEQPDGRDSITLSLSEFDEDNWNTLIGIFDDRQAEIIDFFKAVKGY